MDLTKQNLKDVFLGSLEPDDFTKVKQRLFTKLDRSIALQEENKQEITILNVHMRNLEKRSLSLEDQRV